MRSLESRDQVADAGGVPAAGHDLPAENALTSVEEAYERGAFTGLEPEDHVIFRPERLAVHEVLIRVTGDISVPDGPNYEDLGINFREITGRILSKHIAPRMAEIVRAYDALRERAAEAVGAELGASMFAPSGRARDGSGAGEAVRFLPPRPREGRWRRREASASRSAKDASWRNGGRRRTGQATRSRRASIATCSGSRARFTSGMAGCGAIRRY